MGITRKDCKHLLISLSLILIYFSYKYTVSGYRATTDEYEKTIGIVRAQKDGTFVGGYGAGDLHEAFIATLINVLDLRLVDTGWLSIVIAVVLYTIIILLYFRIINEFVSFQSDPVHKGYGIYLMPLVLVSMPEIVYRFVETSHKGMTFTIFFIISVLVTKDIRRGGFKGKNSLLMLIFGAALVLLNYIWSALFLTFIAILYYALSDNARAWTILGFYAVYESTILIYYPGIRFSGVYYIWRLFKNQRASSTAPETSVAGTSIFENVFFTITSRYPAVDIFGVELNLWIISSIGTIVVLIYVAYLFIVLIYELIKRETNEPVYWKYSVLFILSSIYFGIVSMIGMVTNNITIVRRVIIVPVLTGMIIAGLRDLRQKRSTILTIVLLILLVSVPLGTIRVTSPDILQESGATHHINNKEFALTNWDYLQSEPDLFLEDYTIQIAVEKFGRLHMKIKPENTRCNHVYQSGRSKSSTIYAHCVTR